MSKQPENNDFSRYTTAIDFWKLQCETQWRHFGAFVLPHTLLMAFLLSKFFEKNPSPLVLRIVAIVGLILSILWLFVHIRGVAWSNFRMKMAKECERRLSEYDFLTGRAEDFSKDKEVNVDADKAKMPWYARIKTNKLTTGLILIFILAYLCMAIHTWL
jgi:hypothetical protein